MIYQTDVHCVKKGEFAYFIKIDGTLFCIGTTESLSYWELSDPVQLDDVDLVPLKKEQFFTKKHFGKCKQYLTQAMIEKLLVLK